MNHNEKHKILITVNSVRRIAASLVAHSNIGLVIFDEDVERAKTNLLSKGFKEEELWIIPTLEQALDNFALKDGGLSTKDNYLNSERIKEKVMEIKNTVLDDLGLIGLKNPDIGKPKRTNPSDPFSRSYKGRKKRF